MPEGAVHLDTTPYTLDEVDRPGRRARRAGRGSRTGSRPDERRLSASTAESCPRPTGCGAPHRGCCTGSAASRSAHPRWWDLEIHGAEQVPATGPVVMAANHVGWLDGPLLAICSPRPVHALTKEEMFAGPLGAFLLAAGQIPLDRFHVDLRAIRIAVRVARGRAGASASSPRAPAGRAR